jgi:hypothetical protein
MTKRKNRSNTEYLKGIIRQLKKQNNQLKKELNKALNAGIYDQPQEEPTVPKGKRKPRCPQCKEGILKDIDLGARTLVVCPECSYRKTSNG